MKVVQPVLVTDAVLVSSTVPENDQPEWSSDATYAVGTRVMLAARHRVYEAVKANTGVSPASDATTWIDVGPTNRWAMFDQAVGTLTTATDQIIVTLAPDGLFNALAVLETDAALVRVQMFVGGSKVYDKAKAGPGAGGERTSLLFLDIGEPRRNAQFVVTLTGTGTIGAGTVMVGSLTDLGITEAGVSIGINDFSRRETDDFGVTTVVERSWAKRMTVKTKLDAGQVDAAQRQLARMRAKPVLWIGEEGYDSLAIYGFFKDFSIDLALDTISYCSLTIEGLTDGGVLPPAATPTPTDPEDPLVYVGIHNRYYSVANEKLLDGDVYDSGRFHRAMLSVADPDGKNFGKRLALDEDAGCWSGEAIPVNDPITGALMPPEYLRRKGAWLLNAKASYMGAESFLDPRTKVALIGNLVSGLWVEGNPGRTLVCKGARDILNCFYVKPAKQGDLYDLDERSSVVTDVTLKNMVLLDEVYRWGFFESMAMIRLCGVNGFNVEGIKGYGHRGDFFDIAMSDVGWVEIVQPDGSILKKNNENYHNANGVIRDCFIDGYNQNNRNPITVLDCDGLKVERVGTNQCCKPGGGVENPVSDPMRPKTGLQMPSSLLDVEPNIEVKNPICRDITVTDCRAQNGGGDGVNIFVRANADIPVKQAGFVITDNAFDNIRSGIAVFAVENSADPYGIRYEGNRVQNCRRAHQVIRGETVFMRNNLFENCEHYGDVGYEMTPGSFLPMANSEIVGNTYRKCGTEGAGAFVVAASDNLLIAGNTFDGNSKAGYIHRGGGLNRNYTTRDNTFISAGEPDAVAIGVVTSNGLTPTFDLATCLEKDNVYNGLTNFGLTIPGSRLALSTGGLVTPLGPWPKGATILGEQGAGGGEIMFARVARPGIGTGTGNTGSGNDAPVWEVVRPGGGMLLPSTLVGYGSSAGSSRIAGGIRQDGARLTAAIRNELNFWRANSTYPPQPMVLNVVVPYRGIHGVAAGFTRNVGAVSSLQASDLWAAIQLNGDTARVVKGGVLQNANGNYPNVVSIVAGTTIRIEYNELSGQADFSVVSETGEVTPFGRTNDTGSSTRNIAAVVRMTVARESIDIYG